MDLIELTFEEGLDLVQCEGLHPSGNVENIERFPYPNGDDVEQNAPEWATHYSLDSKKSEIIYMGVIPLTA